MSTTSVQTLRVKGTAEELPEGRQGGHNRGQTSPLWDAVANECRQSPGVWVMFEIPGRDEKSLQSSVQHIKIGKLVAFKQGAWDAAKRGSVLYVKYLGDTTAAVADLGEKRREVA